MVFGQPYYTCFSLKWKVQSRVSESNPEWGMWYQMAVQTRKSKKLYHKGRGEAATRTVTGRTGEVATYGLLVGTSGASGTEQADFRSNAFCLLAGATSTSGTKSSRLGMEHPGAAGSGEEKTWRGGAVVEAGAEAILNELGPK